jgi:hypothetical protein
LSYNPSYPEFEITDYNYISSAIGNAFFSDVPFCTLWECVSAAETREQLDENVSAAIVGQEILDKLVKDHYDGH